MYTVVLWLNTKSKWAVSVNSFLHHSNLQCNQHSTLVYRHALEKEPEWLVKTNR